MCRTRSPPVAAYSTYQMPLQILLDQLVYVHALFHMFERLVYIFDPLSLFILVLQKPYFL